MHANQFHTEPSYRTSHPRAHRKGGAHWQSPASNPEQAQKLAAHSNTEKTDGGAADVSGFPVTTAVISVAGIGTRMFPVTTAIEKCMLPVYAGPLTRPLVDFTVTDCVRAGITRIIFVCTERGKQQLQDYYGELHTDIRTGLEMLSKHTVLEAEARRRQPGGVRFDYVVQDRRTYGTAAALWCARDALRGEQRFAYLGGDDFVWNSRGSSELALAIDEWRRTGSDHSMMGNVVDRLAAPLYGILQLDEHSRLIHIDEKPPIERVPEQPLASISKYLFRDSIWPYVEAELKSPLTKESPEYYITNVLSAAAESGHSIHAHRIRGTYLDGGNPDGLLAAGAFIRSQLASIW